MLLSPFNPLFFMMLRHFMLGVRFYVVKDLKTMQNSQHSAHTDLEFHFISNRPFKCACVAQSSHHCFHLSVGQFGLASTIFLLTNLLRVLSNTSDDFGIPVYSSSDFKKWTAILEPSENSSFLSLGPIFAAFVVHCFSCPWTPTGWKMQFMNFKV